MIGNIMHKRLVVLGILITLILSGYVSILSNYNEDVVVNETRTAYDIDVSGIEIINEFDWRVENNVLHVGDITVQDNAKLIIENISVVFMSYRTTNPPYDSCIYNMDVNGTLILNNVIIRTTNATEGLLDAYLGLTITIDATGANDGTAYINNTQFLYAGEFIATGGAEVHIYNSTFNRLFTSPATEYWDNGDGGTVSSAVSADEDAFNDAPSILVEDGSEVWMVNTNVYNMFEHADNAVYFGTTIASTNPSPNFVINNLTTGDVLIADTFDISGLGNDGALPLYSVDVNITYENDTGYDGTAEVYLIYGDNSKSIGFLSGDIGTNYFESTDNVIDIGRWQDVGTADTIQIWIYESSNGGVYVNTTVDLTIHSSSVFYGYPDEFGLTFDYDRFNLVVDDAVLYGINTNIQADYDSNFFTHNTIYSRNDGIAYFLNLTHRDEYGVEATISTSVARPSCYVSTNDNAEINIYRFADITPTLEGETLNDGAVTVNCTQWDGYTAVDNDNENMFDNLLDSGNDYGGYLIFNYGAGDVTAVTHGLLDSNYYGKHVTTDGVYADIKDGNAVIPLLTDIINYTTLPNSNQVGRYIFNITNPTYDLLESTNASFEVYPNQKIEDNTMSLTIGMEEVTLYSDIDLSVSLDYSYEHESLFGNPLKKGLITITANVTNTGTLTATSVEITATCTGPDGTVSLSPSSPVDIGDIAGSAYVEQDFTFTAEKAGQYAISAVTDNYYWDEDASNNKDNLYITVTSKPNLTVELDTVNVDNVFRYEDTTISANMSCSDVIDVDNVKVQFNLTDGTNVWNLYNDTKDFIAGETKTVSTTWTTTENYPAGTYYIIAKIDPDDTIPESNDVGDNYAYSDAFEIYQNLDFEPDSISSNIMNSTSPGSYDVNITVSIDNNGLDNYTEPIKVKFTSSIDTDTVDSYMVGNNIYAKKVLEVGASNSNVEIEVDPNNDIPEIDENNNILSELIPLPSFNTSVSLPSTIVNGSSFDVNLDITDVEQQLTNVHAYFRYDIFPTDEFELDIGDIAIYDKKYELIAVDTSIISNLMMDGAVSRTSRSLSYVVELTCDEYSGSRYRIAADDMTLYEKPDLRVSQIQIIEYDGPESEFNNSKMAEGVTFYMNITLRNTGGTNAENVTAKIVDIFNGVETVLWEGYINDTAENSYLNCSGDNTYNLVQSFSNLSGLGNHTIRVEVDYNGYITERSEYNNIQEEIVNVTMPDWSLGTIVIDPSEPNTKDRITITIHIQNENATEEWSGVNFLVNISLNGNNIYSQIRTTNDYGRLVIELPAVGDAGDYAVTVFYKGETLTAPAFSVVEAPFVLEWWFYVILICAIIGAALGTAFYVYRKGAIELVECGVCGKLISSDSDKCPYCNAEFEKEKAKCSVCGTWIPMESNHCTNCGAIFAGVEKEEEDYLSKMKVRYDKFLDTYKTQAKKDLDEQYNEEAFQKWWLEHPEYLPFEEWLKQQEDYHKETKACPTCGTLNPRTANTCGKCGSSLIKEDKEEEEKPPEEEEEEKPLEKKKVCPICGAENPAYETICTVCESKLPEEEEEPPTIEEEGPSDISEAGDILEEEPPTIEEEGPSEALEEKPSTEEEPIKKTKKKVLKKIVIKK